MGTKTVLLVEDQLEFAAVQRVHLERNGYRVLTAEDGHQGVRYAREHRPDLILMDFSLPRLDGLHATRALKEDPLTRDIPVIMLTAHGYGTVGRRAREAGCSAFVPKPCEPRRVLSEIQFLIGPAQVPGN
jgi:two-component system, cell cycle response regulator DivK